MRRSLFLSILTLTLAPVAIRGASLPPAVAEAMEQAYHSSDPNTLAHAAETLEQELMANPDQAELRHALAILYLDRVHDPVRAIPYLERIVADLPQDSAWHHALARAYRGAKKFEGAAVHFAKAAELKPGDAWVRYELGNTLSGANRFPEAIAAYRSALEIDDKDVDTRLALARTLWAAGQAAEATTAAQAILEQDPLNSPARKFLLSISEPKPAAPPPTPAVTTATPTPPPAPSKPVHPADAAVAAAYASGKAADFQHAATELESWLERSPRDLPRRKTLAYLYLDKLQSPSQAVPHFAKVVEIAPRDSAWWSLLARAQEAAGDVNGAVASYRRAADCAPRDLWSRYHLACSLRRAGRPAEAEATFREALRFDPKNRHVRRELARCAYDAGRKKDAAEIARELVSEEPADADMHALLGDVERSKYNFTTAGTEYQAALAAQPANAIALSGLREIKRQKRPELKLAYYTFEDTDEFRQSGVFTYASVFLTGRLKASAAYNFRTFEQDPRPVVDRHEASLGLDCRVFSTLQISAGAGLFTTEDHSAVWGGNVALYYQPASFADVWASYRSAEPVNDSYTTASLAFSQSILSAGISVRPHKAVAISATGSQSRYSDGNYRQSFLASLSYYAPLPASPVVRLEYEWLNFDRHTSAYSSPDNYARFRPVLELSPRITDWLKIELHGELSYVFDEQEWGTGYTAGFRANKEDSFDVGVSYMQYEVPGGQTTWSGKGMKVDVSARF